MIDQIENLNNGYKVMIGVDNELFKYEFNVKNDPLPIKMSGRSYEAVEIIRIILKIDEGSAVKLINKERERGEEYRRDMYLTPTNMVNIINSIKTEEKVRFVPAYSDIKSINQIDFQEGIIAANPYKSTSAQFKYDFHWVYCKKSSRDNRVIVKFPVIKNDQPKLIDSYCGYIKIL